MRQYLDGGASAGPELMAIALELFAPVGCANYIRHCGYRVAVQL